MPRTHYVPSDRVHFTWDASNEPRLEIDSRNTLCGETRQVADTRSTRVSTAARLGLDWGRVYPLAGPIAVHGAKPGDTLVVEILDLQTRGWGYTCILRGLGLLP